MANMSYCRFENTLRDLHDCADAIFEEKETSESETRYKRQLIELCREIAEHADAYEEDI